MQMSGILIINASPRREGTSAMFCRSCADRLGGSVCHLYSDMDGVERLMSQIDDADTIIIAGPSYVDTYPAQTVYLLEKIAEHPDICHGQKVYGIINGGMPYVHTHESGLRMLELFCRECNMRYQGGFVIGMGPLLNGRPLDNHLNARKIVPAFNDFLAHIKMGEKSPAKLYYDIEPKLPLIIVGLFARMMNKMIDKNLKKHGFDYKQPSPYWE